MRVFFRDDQLFFLEYKSERIVNSEGGAKEALEQQSILWKSSHQYVHFHYHGHRKGRFKEPKLAQVPVIKGSLVMFVWPPDGASKIGEICFLVAVVDA